MITTLTRAWQRGRVLGWAKGQPVKTHSQDGTQFNIIMRAQVPPQTKVLQQPLRTALSILHTSDDEGTRQMIKSAKISWDELRVEWTDQDGITITIVQVVYTKSPSRWCTVYVHERNVDEVARRIETELPSTKRDLEEHATFQQYVHADKQTTFPFPVTVRPRNALFEDHPGLMRLKEQAQAEQKGKGKGKSGKTEEGKGKGKGKDQGKGKGHYQNRTWVNSSWQTGGSTSSNAAASSNQASADQGWRSSWQSGWKS